MAASKKVRHRTSAPADDGPWRELVQSLTCGIIGADLRGEMFLVNPPARRILELGPSCREGTLAWKALESFPVLLKILLEAPALHNLPNRAETEVRFADGRRKIIGFTATVLRDSSGKPNGAAILFKDLTQIERTEEQERLRDRLAALGQMAAGMAHEVRNPLASIQVTATLLQRSLDRGNGREGPSLVNKILQEVQRLDRTMVDCLEYVKPLTPVLLPTRVEEVLDESVARLGSERPVPGIRFTRDYAEDLPALTADRGLLQQVFHNILANAVEAMDNTGNIHLKLGLETDRQVEPNNSLPSWGSPCLRVSIGDDGPGISRDLQEKLFHPFFTTKKSGSGLGLAVSRKIVEIHEGLIDLESEPGQGTTFHLLFPLAPREKPTASDDRTPGHSQVKPTVTSEG